MKYLDLLENHPFIQFILRRRYIILFTAFFIYIAFFDRYNLVNQWKLSSTIDKMEEEKAFYRQEIKRTKELRKKINSDLEKFARERYFMHREDEDIFVFNPEEK